MLFSSMVFLWIFFPFVIAGNALLGLLPCSSEEKRIRRKNCFLLVCSIFFYAWGGVWYVLIMLGVIVLNFWGALLLSGSGGRSRRGFLAVIILLNILLLFFFKYFNMLIAMVETVMAVSQGGLEGSFWECFFSLEGTGALQMPRIALPIGISFFIFQAMSYVVDVYRGAPPEKSLLDFALYVSLFPQLIAGPIVQYNDIAGQLRVRSESGEDFLYGVRRFVHGLGKKVLIANTLGSVADQIWALETTHVGAGTAWLGMISYTFQIYYDFSGYSDMAIGIGRMLGFRLKENFAYPYTAMSVREFWRRWHISLSSWFRSYVYIPLGGSRQGLAVTCRNLFIVFLLTGIWHGANYTFLAWGLFYAVLLILERLFLGRLLDRNPMKLLNRIYTLSCVMIGWVFFRSNSILAAVEYVGQLFGMGEARYSALSFLNMQVLLALLLGAVGAGFVQRRFRGVSRLYDNFVFQMAILAVSILCLVAGTYNPFIYFQF